MTQQEMFGKALWLGSESYEDNDILILRGKFKVNHVQKATLRVLGLGIFYCYVNGKVVSDDLFLPLNSEYEPRNNFPVDEILAGHRMYVPEYDITDMLNVGENTIAIHFGGGWYTYSRESKFGDAKAIWRIFGTDADGEFDLTSSERDKIGKGFVSELVVPKAVDVPTERHDYTLGGTSALDTDFDDSEWSNASLAAAPVTNYEFSDCPTDKIREKITPVKIFDDGERRVYDAMKNTSGYPVLKINAKKGELITVRLSEERLENGELDPKFCHKQEFSCISDGTGRISHPYFTWFGFRYFEISGNAEVIYVAAVYSNVEVTSSFKSDNEVLNWLYDSFVNTQLTNMHTGIPSDCPHLERRGYTGDGQLACHAAMNILDAEKFYRKWIQDIADSQDKLSGHIQNTAPYTHGGGGPGGFGCAIIEVPYQFYRHYADADVLEKYYPNMLRYFDYLEAHSEYDLVISDKKGEWCLGEWCPASEVILPPQFVNTYFYAKSLSRVIDIARIIGKENDIPALEEKLEKKKRALVRSYYNHNHKDCSCFGSRQGANAFIMDLGLGEEYTHINLVKYYEKLGTLDTGIFGTSIVPRVLFEKGNAELAVKLLTSEDVHTYSEMKNRGATTIWEYWPESLRERSHNHPMFGSATAYLFDFILGIREADGSLTYEKIKIEPMLVESINCVSGHRTLPSGKVSVAYEKKASGIVFNISIPEDLEASFVFDGVSYKLNAGENTFNFQF